jgi:hypothetical protein
MKLRSMLLSFSEWRFLRANPDFHIILEVPANSQVLQSLSLLNEGKWQDAPSSNYSYRVEAPNPAINQRRHVHIASRKHINSKNKQVSWNDTGSRHDKKTFNTNFKGLEQAKTIARAALGLPPDFHLEEYVPGQGLILEDTTPAPPNAIRLRAQS